MAGRVFLTERGEWTLKMEMDSQGGKTTRISTNAKGKEDGFKQFRNAEDKAV
jgi:hypothetical protein